MSFHVYVLSGMTVLAVVGLFSTLRSPDDKQAVAPANSTSHEIELLYHPGDPPACPFWNVNPFDMFVPSPGSGGGACECGEVDSSNTGFVYAWSDVNDISTVKIGCAKGERTHKTNPCQKRMHQEMQAGTRVDYEYICFDAQNCTNWRGHEQCNAGEVYLQDYYYCQGRWLGQHGNSTWDTNGRSNWQSTDACLAAGNCKHNYCSATGPLPKRPGGANLSGKSEWFAAALRSVAHMATDRCQFDAMIPVKQGFKR